MGNCWPSWKTIPLRIRHLGLLRLKGPQGKPSSETPFQESVPRFPDWPLADLCIEEVGRYAIYVPAYPGPAASCKSRRRVARSQPLGPLNGANCSPAAATRRMAVETQPGRAHASQARVLFEGDGTSEPGNDSQLRCLTGRPSASWMLSQTSKRLPPPRRRSTS